MNRKGLSLVEIVISVAILAVCIGVLSFGMVFISQSQNKIHQNAVISSIAENLRARLISDSDFPDNSSTNLFFDHNGQELSDSANAAFKAKINLQSSTNYVSSHLESITLSIYQSKTASLLSTFHLQRAKK